MATTMILDPVAEFIGREHGLLIGGHEVAARSGARFDVINPATGETIATAPEAGREDVDDAVAAARSAFPGWRDTSPAARAELLWRLGFKLSGFGKELGREALELDLQTKTVWVDLS